MISLPKLFYLLVVSKDKGTNKDYNSVFEFCIGPLKFGSFSFAYCSPMPTYIDYYKSPFEIVKVNTLAIYGDKGIIFQDTFSTVFVISDK